MPMTKKDYIKIAKVIRNNSTATGKLVRQSFIDDLCNIFKENNPNFDKVRFINACSIYYESSTDEE